MGIKKADKKKISEIVEQLQDSDLPYTLLMVCGEESMVSCNIMQDELFGLLAALSEEVPNTRDSILAAAEFIKENFSPVQSVQQGLN